MRLCCDVTNVTIHLPLTTVHVSSNSITTNQHAVLHTLLSIAEPQPSQDPCVSDTVSRTKVASVEGDA